MSLFKRKGSSNWYFKLYPPGGGTPLQGSTGTSDRVKAQEYHDRLKVSLWDQAKLGHRPRYTWNDAVVRFLELRAGHASVETMKTHLRWLDPHLNGVELIKIDRACLERIAAAKRIDRRRVRTREGVKELAATVCATTVRRVMDVLMAVLNAAVEWGWLDSAPKVKRERVANRRIRWLTQEEAERLIAELPDHLADMARFSLETGLRRANVTGLQWSQVDLVRRIAWIHPDQAKARKAIAVPLSDTAVAVIRKQLPRKRKPEHIGSVFVYRGKPVCRTMTAAWKKALARAGISDLRWHDLRHTWASWHVQRGTPAQVLKELGGWETMEMVQRYAHLSAGHLAQWVVPLTAAPEPKLAAI